MRRPARNAYASIAVLVGAAALIPVGAVAADVEVTANATTINLDGPPLVPGTTIHVAPGVTVDNSALPAGPAINSTINVWSLTNDGTLLGDNTVNLTAGGSVTNNASGKISAINSSAIVLGDINSGTGTGFLTNAGQITGGTFADAVDLFGGGTVTNLTTGSITTTVGFGNAVGISGGTSGTVDNAGLISNTGASFGSTTGVGIFGLPGSTVTNRATGTIFGTDNGVFADSALILNNSGGISSTQGAAVYAQGGGTFTNQGTIASANSDGILIGQSAVAVVINSGTVSGAVNAINFTNGFGLAVAHTLRLQTGSVLNGNVLGAGSDTLILEGTGTESLSKFLNFASLSVQDTSWTLTGTGTFSTSATVQSGTLNVAGQLTSPTVGVQPGGTLTGNGAVTGAVTNAGNVLVRSGTLTINGNYTQQPGATYSVGVTPSASGLLLIGGGNTATINGGTVAVLAAPGGYAPSTKYTILTVAGGVAGTFGSVSSNFAFLTPMLSYDPNDVYLVLTNNGAALVSAAQTPNQIATAGGLASLAAANPNSPLVTAILSTTAPQARAAFDQLSGEIHASAQSSFLEDSRFLREAAINRIRQAFDPGFTSGAPQSRQSGNVTAWGRGYGSWGSNDSDGNAGTLDRHIGGAFAGADVKAVGNWRIGALAGFGASNVSASSRSSSGSSDNYDVSGYAGTQYGPVGLRFGGANTWHVVSTSRTAAFPGFADFLKANYGADTAQGFGELGYGINAGKARLEPFANVAIVDLRTNAFAETGGQAALFGQSANAVTGFSTFGMHGALAFPVGDMAASARGTLGWAHTLGNTTPLVTNTFESGGNSFLIAGVPLARDSLVVGAGLDVKVTPAATLSLEYSGVVARNAQDQGARGAFTWKF